MVGFCCIASVEKNWLVHSKDEVNDTVSSYTEPNFEKCAVITIDTQNDFSLPGAVAEIKGTYEVIPHMESILRVCRVQKIPINFPNCPRTSMYEASERDFRVVMVEDAISGVYPKGIEEVQNIGVNIYSTNEFIDALTVSIP